MSDPAARLDQAADLAEIDSGLMHEIVHRPADGADVITEGGPVKPLAKIVAQGEQAYDDSIAAKASLADAQRIADAAASAAATEQIAFQGEKYLGTITALGMALVAPAANIGAWYSSGVNGTLSGTNSGGLAVSFGDLVFSDGSGVWKKRLATLTVVTLGQLEARLQELLGTLDPVFSDYAFTIVDSVNRCAFAIDKAGNIIGKFSLQAGAVTLAALDATVGARLPDAAWTNYGPFIAQTMGTATGFAWAIVDNSNRMALAIDLAGNVIGKFQITDGTITFAKLSTDIQSRLPTVLANVEYAYVIVDANDKMAFAIKVDGTVYFPKFQLPAASIGTAQLVDDAVTRQKIEAKERRQSLNVDLDVVPVISNDWRFTDGQLGAKTAASGTGWERLTSTPTKLVRGIASASVSLDFRRSSRFVVRGKNYKGTYDPTAGGVASLVYKGDKFNGDAAPSGGSPVTGDYYYFVDATGTVGALSLVRGDLIVYNGSAWVKQAAPVVVVPGDYYIVSVAGSYDGINVPALNVGDRLVYAGFQSNSGSGKSRWMVDTRTGVFYYRGEFTPSGGLPGSPADGEMYAANAAGSTGGFTFANDDVLIRDAGVWCQITGEPIKTVAAGAYAYLPCVADANEWEVRRTDKSATQASLIMSTHRSALSRRHHDDVVHWGDSMPGKVSVALAAALSPRGLTTLSYGGGTSRNVLSMVEHYIVRQADVHAGKFHILWHGQNNQSDNAQIFDAAGRIVSLIGSRDLRYLHMSVLGQRVMSYTGGRMVCTQQENQFLRVAGDPLRILQFLEQTYPSNYFDTRAQLCASATATLKDPQFPGMTELAVATTYGIVPLSYFLDYSTVPWDPNVIAFAGYYGTAGLPAGGADNDYYIRSANGTVGNLLVRTSGAWAEYTYDSTHLFNTNAQPGNVALAAKLAAFINQRGW